MLVKLEDDKLLRIGAVSDGPVPDYAEWKEQGGKGRAVAISNDINLSTEEIDVSELDLIVLSFPAYKDGRAYTQARTLRERFGFAGDIRACGDVLRDQVQFMARCGFSSFELGESANLEGYEQSLGDFSLFYQPAPAGIPVWQQRHDSARAQRRIA